MKPAEILAALPEWREATPSQLLASPAWTLPCRLGETPGALRLDAIRPAETLDLLVRFENDEHTLSLADSPLFPELHKVWPSRSVIPEPIILALVEKECGPLLQLLENVLRRQLAISGLAKSRPQDDDAISARIVAGGNTLASFTLTKSPALVETLGSLRFIDISHPSVRSREMQAEVELAAFALAAGDIPETGDALLLPELDPSSGAAGVRLVADGVFSVSPDTGVTAWTDDGLWRVVRSDRISVTFGDMADLSAEKAEWPAIPAFAAAGAVKTGMPLDLVRSGATAASGRLVRIGAAFAFALDAVR